MFFPMVFLLFFSNLLEKEAEMPKTISITKWSAKQLFAGQNPQQGATEVYWGYQANIGEYLDQQSLLINYCKYK